MNLNEAIDHALEVAEAPDYVCKCREDHLQLAIWLMETKVRRAKESLNLSLTMTLIFQNFYSKQKY